MTKSTKGSKAETFTRFDTAQRIQHILFLISFSVLGFTGLPQRYMLSPISLFIFDVLGGVERVRLIHHTSAIVMMIVSVFHVVEVLYRVFVLRTPISMIPWINDAQHVYDDVLYYIGLRKHKAYYGRYSYAEKMEYLALIWGTVVMGFTGFMMWNPISTLRFFPGEALPAAKAAHGGEAVLAVLAIVIWHFYHVHIKELNKSMFTGTLSREEMEHEHPAELAAIDSGENLIEIPEAVLRKRQRIYTPVAVTILVLFAVGFYFFVGYETTAVTTMPKTSPVQVYVPQKVPSSAGNTIVTWDASIGPLFTQKCLKCHGASAAGGLILFSYTSAMKGGVSGTILIPNDSVNSFLITELENKKHPSTTLTLEELIQIKTWIDTGALEK